MITYIIMFLLLDNDIIVEQSLEILPLLNRLGFLNKNQYYNYKTGKIKNKFNHIKGRYSLINIEQRLFFQENMLFYPNLLI
jgi:hypothetical protein